MLSLGAREVQGTLEDGSEDPVMIAALNYQLLFIDCKKSWWDSLPGLKQLLQMSNGDKRDQKLRKLENLEETLVLKEGEKSSPGAKYAWLLLMQISLL